MHVAYAILMTTPWVVGTLLILAGIGVILGRILMEEKLYCIGLHAYQESKGERDQETLENLISIFEEMLKRVAARKHQKQLKLMYDVVTRHSFVGIHYPLPIDSCFDTSELRKRNAYRD